MLHRLSLFTPEVRQFEHFNFNAAAAKNAGLIVMAVWLGVVLAALYNFYMRHVPGSAVRALLAAGALSPESAKTAEELQLSRLARRELIFGSVLSRIVRYVGDEPAEDGTCAPRDATARYYIPEEQKYRAEIRFESKGNGTVGLILTAVLGFGLALLVIRLLPWFLGVIDNIL